MNTAGWLAGNETGMDGFLLAGVWIIRNSTGRTETQANFPSQPSVVEWFQSLLAVDRR